MTAISLKLPVMEPRSAAAIGRDQVYPDGRCLAGQLRPAGLRHRDRGHEDPPPTRSGRSPDRTERPKPDTDVGCGVEFHLWPVLPKRLAAHRRGIQLGVASMEQISPRS